MLAAAPYLRHACTSPANESGDPGHMTVKTSSSQALNMVSQEFA